MRFRQPVQPGQKAFPQALALQPLPLIPTRRVGQGKTGHKIVPVEGDGLLQLLGGVLDRGLLGAGEQAQKVVYVHPQVRLPQKGDAVAIAIDPRLPGGLVKNGQGAAQIAPGVALVVAGPEERRQQVTGLGAGFQGQIDQQGEGFGPVYGQGGAVHRYHTGAEELEGELGHGYSCLSQAGTLSGRSPAAFAAHKA